MDDHGSIGAGERRRRPPTHQLLDRRRMSAAAAEGRPPAEGVSRRDDVYEGVRVGVFEPAEPHASALVFYLHGGGFRQGSVQTYAHYTSHLAALVGARLVSVDFRLAPEDPFPSGLDDAVTAYRRLDAELPADTAVVVAGDSSGGGLVAGLLMEIRTLGLRRPAAAVLVSPWVDLRNTAESFRANAGTDDVFPLASAVEAADMYLAGWDPTDTRVSPLLADWSGQPPLLIAASEIESLRDDAVSLAATARAAGVPVELTMFADTAHGWWLEYPSTPASVQLMGDVVRFVRSRLCREI